MSATNKKTNGRLEVEVKRVEPVSLSTAELAPTAKNVFPVLRLNLGGSSQLVRRPANEMAAPTARQDSFTRIRIKLDEGTMKVNSRTVKIPLGLCGRMTGKKFKEFANVYKGDALYVRQPNGLQRVRDNETIELFHGAEFTHQRKQPEIRTVPRYNGS